MFYKEQREIAKQILKRTDVQTVYVNAQYVERDKEIFVVSGEQFVGFNDTLGLYAYIRQIGDAPTKTKDYTNYIAEVNLKIVIAGSGFKNAEFLILKIASALGSSGVIINSFLTDQQKLFKSENKLQKDVSFENAVYIGLDVTLYVPFSLSDCQNMGNCETDKLKLQLCDFEI